MKQIQFDLYIRIYKIERVHACGSVCGIVLEVYWSLIVIVEPGCHRSRWMLSERGPIAVIGIRGKQWVHQCYEVTNSSRKNSDRKINNPLTVDTNTDETRHYLARDMAALVSIQPHFFFVICACESERKSFLMIIWEIK